MYEFNKYQILRLSKDLGRTNFFTMNSLSLKNFISMGGKLSQEQWFMVSKSGVLDNEFIIIAAPYLNWAMLVQHQIINEDILLYFAENIGWEAWRFISTSPKYPMTDGIMVFLLSVYPQFIDMTKLEQSTQFDEIFLTYHHLVPWNSLSCVIAIDKQLDRLVKFKKFLDWNTICNRLSNYVSNKNESLCNCFDEEFMMNVAEYLNWEIVFKFQHVSSNVIRHLAYGEILTPDAFDIACKVQKIDECIYDELPFEPEWSIVCEHQCLSSDFMDSHYYALNWDKVAEHQLFSPVVFKKYSALMPMTENVIANIRRWRRVSPLVKYIDADAWSKLIDFIPMEEYDRMPTIAF